MHVTLRDGRRIPDAELEWTFARSDGPGGQSVNTTDSAVRLVWWYGTSAVLQPQERQLLQRRLGHRADAGRITVTAREHRGQWANRSAAAKRLTDLVSQALAPAPPPRLPTNPSRAARGRRLQAKRARAETKRQRRPPGRD